jgi:hypothetical protein
MVQGQIRVVTKGTVLFHPGFVGDDRGAVSMKQGEKVTVVCPETPLFRRLTDDIALTTHHNPNWWSREHCE